MRIKNRKALIPEWKYVGIALAMALTVLLIAGVVFAQELINYEPTLWDKIKAQFRQILNVDYSIVGQARHCDVLPEEEWYLAPGETFSKTKGNCLFDTFVDNWIPVKERKDTINIQCGYNHEQCIVQMYCNCDPECTSDSQCAGGECIISTATDPYIQLDFSSWSYCTEACTGSPITCWREEQGVCVSRTYTCGYDTYPNCPASYQYTSKSQCEASLPEEAPYNWVNSATECISPRPVGCADKRCVTTASECGTCTWECDYVGQIEIIDISSYKKCELVNSNCGSWVTHTSCLTFLTEAECIKYDGCEWKWSLAHLKSVCKGTTTGEKEPPSEMPEDKEEPTKCVAEEGLFYTDAEFLTKLKKKFSFKWTITSGEVINPGQLAEHFPFFPKRFRENKDTACCEGLSPSLMGEKTREFSEGAFFFTVNEGTLNYLQYKCVPEGESECWIEFAHLLLEPYTHSDCKTNSILFVIIVIFGFIIISRFAG